MQNNLTTKFLHKHIHTFVSFGQFSLKANKFFNFGLAETILYSSNSDIHDSTN
jgi:hypothetical protein